MSRSEVVCLRTCFDAFHNNVQLQRLGHGQNLRKNRNRNRVSADCLGEGLVDLDGVHGKIMQICQARIAGTEIVDMQRNGHFGEGGESCLLPLAVEPYSFR